MVLIEEEEQPGATLVVFPLPIFAGTLCFVYFYVDGHPFAAPKVTSYI
jgi:hypothetical protein